MQSAALKLETNREKNNNRCLEYIIYSAVSLHNTEMHKHLKMGTFTIMPDLIWPAGGRLSPSWGFAVAVRRLTGLLGPSSIQFKFSHEGL